VFFNTYTEARAPGRLPNVGVMLLGPTLMAFGSAEQQQRFVPPMLAAEELWCQGYSEPGAGSDLAGVATTATRSNGRWVINGQKVWTSLAQHADWIFVLARSTPGSQRHAGLSYLLVPMDQPGIEIRPIVQINGGVEFNETFFDDAVTDADLVVGGAGNGWKVAMGTLAFERGASTLGQQTSFRQEFDSLLSEARESGHIRSDVLRSELVQSHIELEILRYNQMRMLTSLTHDRLAGPEQSIGKLFLAALVPGIIATLGYSIAIGVYVRLKPESGPVVPAALRAVRALRPPSWPAAAGDTGAIRGTRGCNAAWWA